MTDYVQYSLREMLAPLRYELRPKPFLISTLVGNSIQTHQSTKIEIDVENGGRRVAAYKSRHADPEDVTVYGYDSKIHVLPYTRQRITLTPDDLELRLPGNTIYEVGSAGAHLDELMGKYLRDLDDRIIRLEELQLAEAITSGTCTVSGDGVSYTVDYGRDSNNEVTLTGADVWSETTADISGNFRDAADQMRSVSGGTPTLVVMGTLAAKYYTEDTTVLAKLDNRSVAAGQFELQYNSSSDSTFLGMHRDVGINCEVHVYHGTYDDSSGTVTPYIAPADVIFIRKGLRATGHYSMISNFNSSFVGRRYPSQYLTPDGTKMIVQIESGPLMAVHEINATYALHTGVS